MSETQTSKIHLFSSILTIFIFITGIQNLSSIFGFEKINGIIDSEVSKSISYGLLLISQSAYYLSYYYILRFIHIKINEDDIMFLDEAKPKFFLVIFTLLGIGITIFFFEGFWGKIDLVVENGNLAPLIIFGILSTGLNLMTVYSAMNMDASL